MNKKAQISETTTWIVATIIIIIILLASVLLASILGKIKAFPVQNEFDIFSHKSFTSYLLTKDAGGEIVYDEIKNDGNFNDFNGNLAKKILTGLYSGYYNKDVFLGIYINRLFAPLQGNTYFAVPPGETPNSLLRPSDDNNIIIKDSILLNENKAIQMVLWHTN